MNSAKNQSPKHQTPVVLLLLTTIAVLMNCCRLQAQVTPRCRVAVLNMASPSSTSQSLGKDATDVFSAVLKKQGVEVTPRKIIEQTIKDFGFHLPLSQSEMQTLGTRLHVDRIVIANITDITFTETPRQASVILSLSLIDIAKGDFIDLGLGVGHSLSAARKESDTKRIKEAISKAVDSVQYLLQSISMPIATIITMQDPGVVILNRGSRDGIHIGDEGIVMRVGERLSRLRVVRADATESIGSILEGGKRKVGDQVLFLPPKPRPEQ